MECLFDQLANVVEIGRGPIYPIHVQDEVLIARKLRVLVLHEILGTDPFDNDLVRDRWFCTDSIGGRRRV